MDELKPIYREMNTTTFFSQKSEGDRIGTNQNRSGRVGSVDRERNDIFAKRGCRICETHIRGAYTRALNPIYGMKIII